MSLDALKPFFPNPCIRMKEVCEILSDDPDLILETAYRIALFIISGKIKILMGDINQLQDFIIGCEDLFSKPIPSKNILIKGENGDGTQYEDTCIGYIDYTDRPGCERYDSVLGAAHEQYVELLGDYNYLGRDLHLSPKEVYEALYSAALRDSELDQNSKIMKRYLTGKEIFDAGICTPVELGEKCWSGSIKAWDETGAAQYSSQEQWEEMKCGCHSWQVIPFPFGLEEYSKENGGPGLAIASEYKADLSGMLFEVDEVKKLFSVSSPAVRTPPLTGKPVHELQGAASTGSNKDVKRIQATRRACETIRGEIERGKHGFRVKGEYKTNRAHFIESVQNLLGSEKAHRDTLREEWAKLPENIKHPGRVPDQ